MVQSRLAAKFNRLFLTASFEADRYVAWRRLISSAISGGVRTADPQLHAVRPEEIDDASEAAKAACSSVNQSNFKSGEDPCVIPNPVRPASSSPKIQSNSVNQPRVPVNQQKRRISSFATASGHGPNPGEFSCVGLDGSPWPEKDKLDRRGDRKEAEEDDKEYFEHHKASPLSEIEIVDSRKPITSATDGSAGTSYGGYGSGVILWRPEQLDTAEDSLRRATEIWKANAVRGDPDSPHGRVLRALRGEYW